jgi:hypothetical protein
MKKRICKCGGDITQDKCFNDGFLVECLKCQSCGEILYSINHMKELIKLREANKEIEGERKIIKVGSSIAALLPKKIMRYGVKEGMVDSVRVLSTNSLEIRFSKDII